MDYRVQNWVSWPNINDFRHLTWTYHKVFEKRPQKCGKNEGENYFSPLWCLIQKLDHNSGLHAKNQREISKNEVRSPPHPLYGNVDIPLWIFLPMSSPSHPWVSTKKFSPFGPTVWPARGNIFTNVLYIIYMIYVYDRYILKLAELRRPMSTLEVNFLKNKILTIFSKFFFKFHGQHRLLQSKEMKMSDVII